MALSQSAVSDLLEAFRTSDGMDLVKESVRLVMQQLIEAKAAEHFGAARYERTESRTGERNGSRPRLLTTQAGDVALRIPKVRAGTGRAGKPLPRPYAKPISMGIVYRAWDRARATALDERQYNSALARRPYDLRHAAVSLWLNAGVSPAQVAEWAGHSVHVLLQIYASCVFGQEDEAKRRIGAALDD